MKPSLRFLCTRLIVSALLLVGACAGRGYAKDKTPPLDPNDPTLRLFQLLDTSYAGKLEEFYLLGGVAKDSQNPDQEEQRVLKVEYDKSRLFGKLRIYVRTVGQLSPEQRKAYTPKQIFEFAEVDAEKFTKTDPGPLGKAGDVYFRPAMPGGPLASAPVSDAVRSEYEQVITSYLLPALEKK